LSRLYADDGNLDARNDNLANTNSDLGIANLLGKYMKSHKNKSKIISLSKGVDFVGFRNYYYFKLLRQRNIKGMKRKIQLFHNNHIPTNEILEIFQGWQAHVKSANTYNLRKHLTQTLKLPLL